MISKYDSRLLLPGERIYPIYSFSAKWRVDDAERDDGTSHEQMFKIGFKHTDAHQYALDWWERLIRSDVKWGGEKKVPYIERGVELLDLKCKYLGRDSWVLNWFNHMTLNVHLSDEDLLRSFRNYVDRITSQNERNGHYHNNQNPSSKLPYVCLMGADDRWRWKGPCRCEHCVRRGVTFIDH